MNEEVGPFGVSGNHCAQEHGICFTATSLRQSMCPGAWHMLHCHLPQATSAPRSMVYALLPPPAGNPCAQEHGYQTDSNQDGA